MNASVKLYTSAVDCCDHEEPDYVFCGAETLPKTINSDGPVLVMTFSSGTTQGAGFKAIYSFQTDYKVPGTADPPGCKFKYLSDSAKQGDFNSPRYPSSYPASSYCEYELVSESGEQIEIVFTYFKFKSELIVKSVGYNDVCSEDWIEIYEIYPSGRNQKIGRYCASSAPGPFLSALGVNVVRIILNTDETGHASGFRAKYAFLPNKSSTGGK